MKHEWISNSSELHHCTVPVGNTAACMPSARHNESTSYVSLIINGTCHDFGSGHCPCAEVGENHSWSPATNVADSNGIKEREEDCKN